MILSTLYRKYTPIQVRSWISELREAGGRRQAWKAVQRGEYESTYPAECAYMRNRGDISTFPYAWSELRVLQGAKEVLMYPDTKVFICAYHHEKDREELSGFLEKQGFQVTTSNSRLFYRFPGDTRYSFRAGVLRAQK